MKNLISNILILSLLVTNNTQAQPVHKSYDVVIYGATCAGVTAAVAAKQNGVSVILLSPEKHIGRLFCPGGVFIA